MFFNASLNNVFFAWFDLNCIVNYQIINIIINNNIDNQLQVNYLINWSLWAVHVILSDRLFGTHKTVPLTVPLNGTPKWYP